MRSHTARALALTGATVIASVLAIAAARPAAGHAATALTYQFQLGPANTALAPATNGMAQQGDTIKVTGSGTFSPPSTIKASGKFTHYNANGTVHCQGTWKATALDGFTPYGPDANGDVGGVISMTTTHTCSMGMTMTGVPMTVTSAIAGASGTTGTTVGPFTQATGGGVQIQQQ